MNALEELVDYCFKHAPGLMSHAKTIEKFLESARNDKPLCGTCFYFARDNRFFGKGVCMHPLANPGRDVSISIINSIGYYDVEAGSVYMGEQFGCIHHESATEQSLATDRTSAV